MISNIILSLLLLTFFHNTKSDQVDLPLTTKKGPIIGVRIDPNPDITGVPYDAFIGIPYGKIPTRFQLAEARSSWSEPLYTQTDGPPCPQPDVDFSEDCLFINVFSPVNSSSSPGTLPVVVFVHGSAFTKSSSNSEFYAPDFLVNASIVFVAMNFRLGSLGFLTLGSTAAPGNMGLQDTVLALQWVQDEISTFGGDPSTVTLYGSSSGSIMTMMHYLSPVSAGLFERVIGSSGSALADWGHYTVTEGARRARLLADAVGCDSTQNDSLLISCLQQTNITAIVNNQDITLSDAYSASGRNMPWLPVLDTYLTSDSPFFNDTWDNLMTQALARSKPILTGINSDEGIIKFEDNAWSYVKDNFPALIPETLSSTLSDEDKVTLGNKIKNKYFNSSSLDANGVRELIYLYRDSMFGYPLIQMTRFFANLTYGYFFAYDGSWVVQPDYFTQYRMRGVNHADDLYYLFYNFSNKGSQDLSNCMSNQLNLDIYRYMITWWTNFAKTGIIANLGMNIGKTNFLSASRWHKVPDESWKTVGEGGYYLVINNSLSTMSSGDFESLVYSFWADLAQDISSATTTTLNTVLLLIIALCSSTLLSSYVF